MDDFPAATLCSLDHRYPTFFKMAGYSVWGGVQVCAISTGVDTTYLIERIGRGIKVLVN